MSRTLVAKLPPEIAPLIAPIAGTYGLEPSLVAAIVVRESSGNTDASRFEPGWKYFVGPDGRPCNGWQVEPIPLRAPGEAEDVYLKRKHAEGFAQATSWGLMQTMGAVARELGFRAPDLGDLRHPQIGLEYGCKHLAHYRERYDLLQAISAYNAGPGGIGSNRPYVESVVELKRLFEQDGVA